MFKYNDKVFSDLVKLIRFYLQPASTPHPILQTSEREIFIKARYAGLLPILNTIPLREQFSQQTQKSLRRAFLHGAVHYARLTRHLSEILTAFSQQGIVAIPFKGVVLSQQLYGDPAFRSCADIDFMVKSADVLLAVEALRNRGYEFSLPSIKRHYLSLVEQLDYYEFGNRQNGVLVDLQWPKNKGYCPHPLPEQELFFATQLLDLTGERISAFIDPIALYYLCTHGAKNSWCELRALIDISRAMEVWDDAIWSEAAKMMRARGILNMMMCGVWLAHQLFCVDIPATVSNYTNGSVRRLSEKIRHHWLRFGFTHPQALKRFYWDLCFRESMIEKSHYLAFRLRPTKTDLIGRESKMAVIYAKRFSRILKRKKLPVSVDDAG
ncbi:nucleotidyltransferase family protein [candidate division KSB1 bacterium]|nr:nucleotidyltransferase family protein [candidate division KSB1 bacterium]